MTPERPRFLYLEHDGRVFLVRREGRLTFPREGEAPCAYDVRVDIDLGEALVLFAVPRLDAWPRAWPLKDEVPGMADVDPIVHRAINASLVREVTGAIVLAGAPGAERMLLVKSSRGFAKGLWNVPGGFVVYGESPEEGVVREVKEECGLDVRVERLLGVYTARFKSPYFTRAHVFLTRADTEALDLSPDEIAEAEWVPVDAAYARTFNPFARAALEALRKGA